MRRAAPPREIPPPLELECLKVLWKLGQGSVRDVRHELAEDRKLAYTTVMTVLDRLEKRGAVTRQKRGRAFVYEPKLTRDALRQFAVKSLLEAFFDGSGQQLIDYLGPAAVEGEEIAVESGAGKDCPLGFDNSKVSV